MNLKKISCEITDATSFKSFENFLGTSGVISSDIADINFTGKLISVVLDVDDANAKKAETLLTDSTKTKERTITAIAHSDTVTYVEEQALEKSRTDAAKRDVEQNGEDSKYLQALRTQAYNLNLGVFDNPQIDALSFLELQHYVSKYVTLEEIIREYLYLRDNNQNPTRDKMVTTHNTTGTEEMLEYIEYHRSKIQT